jgi:predicted phosphodiesterase
VLVPRVRFGALSCALAAALLTSAEAHAEGGVRKGPYLMAPRPGAITVMVERDAPGPLTVRAWRVAPEGVDVGAPIEVRDTASVNLHEVLVEGLAPGVRYHYQVTGPGITGNAEGIFSTAPARSEPFRFLLYGDTRSNVTSHAAIVTAMRREGPDFVVHTGDLLADGRSERQWNDFFAIERDLLRDTVFIPVVGNHELRNSSRIGIENFRRYVNCPPPDAPRPELDYVVRFGNVQMVLANAYDDWTTAPMRNWLEEHLAQARRDGPNDFLLVVTHWGMHSSGPHGENRSLRAAGLPEMFRRYGVDLVVAGHDHVYERGEERGLRYIVTGGSGAPLYSRRTEHNYTRVFAAQHHYVRVDADGEKLELTAVRPDGTILDRFTIRHPQARARVAAAAAIDPGALALAPSVTEEVAAPDGPPSRHASSRHHRDGSSRRHHREDQLPIPPPPSPSIVRASAPTVPTPPPGLDGELHHAGLRAHVRRTQRVQSHGCLCAYPGVASRSEFGVGLIAFGLCAMGLGGRRSRRT